MNEEKMPAFFAGFGLSGRRQKDGTIVGCLDEDVVIPDWPEEYEMYGHTYALETIHKGKDGFECAEYC